MAYNNNPYANVPYNSNDQTGWNQPAQQDFGQRSGRGNNPVTGSRSQRPGDYNQSDNDVQAYGNNNNNYQQYGSQGGYGQQDTSDTQGYGNRGQQRSQAGLDSDYNRQGGGQPTSQSRNNGQRNQTSLSSSSQSFSSTTASSRARPSYSNQVETPYSSQDVSSYPPETSPPLSPQNPPPKSSSQKSAAPPSYSSKKFPSSSFSQASPPTYTSKATPATSSASNNKFLTPNYSAANRMNANDQDTGSAIGLASAGPSPYEQSPQPNQRSRGPSNVDQNSSRSRGPSNATGTANPYQQMSTGNYQNQGQSSFSSPAPGSDGQGSYGRNPAPAYNQNGGSAYAMQDVVNPSTYGSNARAQPFNGSQNPALPNYTVRDPQQDGPATYQPSVPAQGQRAQQDGPLKARVVIATPLSLDEKKEFSDGTMKLKGNLDRLQPYITDPNAPDYAQKKNAATAAAAAATNGVEVTENPVGSDGWVKNELDTLNPLLQRLRDLKERKGKDEPDRLALDRLYTRYQEMVTVFQRDMLSRKGRAENELRDTAKRQYQIINPGISDEEAYRQVDTTDYQEGLFAQALKTSNRQLRANQTLSNVKDRHFEIVQIAKQLTELNELFLQVNQAIEVQGQQVETVVETTKVAAHDTVEGAAHMGKAENSSRKARMGRKCIIWFVVVAVVLLAIVAVAVYFGYFKPRNDANKRRRDISFAPRSEGFRTLVLRHPDAGLDEILHRRNALAIFP